MPKIGKGQEILKLLLPQLSKDMQKTLATLLFDSLASHLPAKLNLCIRTLLGRKSVAYVARSEAYRGASG